jgi:heme-degrading monooxygenase HmoA
MTSNKTVQVIVRHKVKDYDAWFPVFYEHGKERRRFGCLDESVHRSAADPDETVVVMRFPDLAAFQAFAAGSKLEEAMARGGVVDQPTIYVTGEAVFQQQHAAPATAKAR